MQKKYLFVLLSVIAILAIAVFPVGAVTDGEEDGDGHPYVGLMIAQDASGNPLWRCSGTLLSDTLFLTAGHCTEAPAAHVEIWFYDQESDILANGYPFVGQVGGTPYTHPDYNPNAFFVRDVGVVVLDAAYPMAEYGALPSLNQLDALKTRRGLQNQSFTSVGYGLQKINPVFVEAVRTRMVAHPHLIQINVPGFTGDFSILLSNNHSTGGTCFGDSGGPNFLGDSNVVAGVTSFGINGNCAGTGGVFRMDRSWSLDWVNSFLD
jgi:hypothetical protein